jgi:hypothetical protein
MSNSDSVRPMRTTLMRGAGLVLFVAGLAIFAQGAIPLFLQKQWDWLSLGAFAVGYALMEGGFNLSRQAHCADTWIELIYGSIVFVVGLALILVGAQGLFMAKLMDGANLLALGTGLAVLSRGVLMINGSLPRQGTCEP